MPRKWLVEVKPWPKLAPGKLYPMRVVDIRKSGRPAGILVTFEPLCRKQAGRRHEVLLPLDIFPDNPTARFLRAVGLSVGVGEKVCPTDATGAVINVVFGPSRSGKGPEPITFHPIKEESKDDG